MLLLLLSFQLRKLGDFTLAELGGEEYVEEESHRATIRQQAEFSVAGQRGGERLHWKGLSRHTSEVGLYLSGTLLQGSCLYFLFWKLGRPGMRGWGQPGEGRLMGPGWGEG